MKKLLMLLFSLTLISMYATSSSPLTFKAADKSDDLTPFKELLFRLYPMFAKDDAARDTIKQTLIARFAVLLGWVGKEQHRFVKIYDGQKPIGFLTLEALDKEKTKIALHHSPLLPEYLASAKTFLVDQVKAQFPQAKTLYSSASGAAPHLQALVKSLGFAQDDTYKPNSELVPDSNGFVGYRKDL